MPVAHYDASIAYDQKVKRGVPGQVARVVHPGTDLPIEQLLDPDGNPISALVSNSQGFVEPFTVLDGPPFVKMAVGSVRYFLLDLNLVGAAAESAQAAAEAAQRAAALVEAPADDVIATLAVNPASLTHAALDAATGALVDGPRSELQTAGDFRWMTRASADYYISTLLGAEGTETQIAGDARYAKRGGMGVLAADYGALGDGVNNDYWTIQASLNASNGKEVILEGGKTYRIAGTITVPAGQDSLSIRAVGPKPAILMLGADGQSYPAINADAGGPVKVTTLAASVGINTRGWPVADTSGIAKGMLCEVISSAPWYHDPRPESAPNDARKSELHKVQGVFDGRVWMDDPANDGYDLANETVELRFFKPIRVRLENLTVRGALPAHAAETKACEGIIVQGADEPLLIDVNAENCARTGVTISRSWRPRSYGGYTRGSNNFYNGYGLSVRGCAHALIDGRHTYESNKGVDVTGFNCISRHTVVQNCKTFGGGINSRGDYYGWKPDGTTGTQQSGFGNHGAADNTTYRFNTVVDVWSPFGIRGRNTYIHNNLILGRTTGGVVRAYLGTNLYVMDNRIIAGYWSLKPANSFGGPHIDSMRADTIVTVYDTWQANPASGIRRGQLVVSGNEAELRTAAVRLHMLHRGEMYIANNRLMFMDTNLPRTCYVIDNNSGEVPTTVVASAWTVGPNDARSPNGTVAVQRSNTSVAGAKVLDYVTAV